MGRYSLRMGPENHMRDRCIIECAKNLMTLYFISVFVYSQSGAFFTSGTNVLMKSCADILEHPFIILITGKVLKQDSDDMI
jgi:hypothetical protein